MVNRQAITIAGIITGSAFTTPCTLVVFSARV
jgi:hypothetical protein